MSEKVQFVITSEGWDESFEDVSLSLFFLEGEQLLGFISIVLYT